jgi:hypothetical protein
MGASPGSSGFVWRDGLPPRDNRVGRGDRVPAQSLLSKEHGPFDIVGDLVDRGPKIPQVLKCGAATLP